MVFSQADVSTNFMNDLLNIFKPENLELIPNHFWDTTKPTCWYPSSGMDFRHIFFWDYLSSQNKIQKPKIYIHTDFLCLDSNPLENEKVGENGKQKPHPLLRNGYLLDIFGNNNRLTVENCTELFLKEDVLFPNNELFQFGKHVADNTHRIFAIQCQQIDKERDFLSLQVGETFKNINGEINEIEEIDKIKLNIKSKGKIVRTPLSNCDLSNTENKILILLFTVENSNFFYDIILPNKIKIDYLTHIRDGGASKGGSIAKMDFIYLYADTLRLKKIIVDCTLKEKSNHFIKWTSHYYKNPKVERDPNIRKEPEINLKVWKVQKVFFPNSKGIYIKSKHNTGNHQWNDNYFDKEPLNELPIKTKPPYMLSIGEESIPICQDESQYEKYYYYER